MKDLSDVDKKLKNIFINIFQMKNKDIDKQKIQLPQ